MTDYDISDFPTILLIDSNDRDSTNVALLKGSQIFSRQENARAQELPSMVEQVLAEAKLEPAQLRAICVLKRDGSLTGVRLGVTVANTLAWLSSTPIIELADYSFTEAIDYLKTKKKFRIQKIASTN